MYLHGNIDILPSMPTANRGSMTSTKQQHLALVLILVSVSALALQTPLSTLVHAQEQSIQSIVTINASGIAFRMEDGSSPSATLTLTGSSENDVNEKLGDLSGVLQIGSTVYNVSNGQGEGNMQGIIEINADAGGDQNLILHGTNRNGDVVFNFPESKLSTQYSLYLVGQLSSSGNSFTPLSSDTSFGLQSNSESSLSSQANISSSFSTQNSSSSEVSSSTTQNESENTTMTPTFTPVPSITQTVTSIAPLAQAGNSTTIVTVTANVTVTVTTTSTVANTTITVHP
jgi:hypothetical protein